MLVLRAFALILLLGTSAGCQALKDDPIMGDHAWQPSGLSTMMEK